MRVGTNEAKSSPDLSPFKRHRIVIPVYIPNLQGYYSEALDVLRLCLASLRASIGASASVTIVSNASAPEVERHLRSEYDQGWIDQLLLNQRNWGRIDAVVSSARGTFEQLITISDCDVLFLPGWLEAVEDVFLKFPECGFASPVPGLNIWYHTSATMLSGMLRGELRMEKIVPEHDLDRISASIRRNMFKAEHREAQLVIRRADARHRVAARSSTACRGARRCGVCAAARRRRGSIFRSIARASGGCPRHAPTPSTWATCWSRGCTKSWNEAANARYRHRTTATRICRRCAVRSRHACPGGCAMR